MTETETQHEIDRLIKEYCQSWPELDRALFKAELERLVIIAKREQIREEIENLNNA